MRTQSPIRSEMKMLCISLTRPALFPRSAASKTSTVQSINPSRHREAQNWRHGSQPHKYHITASIPREVMMSASGADVGSSTRSVVVAVDETKVHFYLLLESNLHKLHLGVGERPAVDAGQLLQGRQGHS